MAKEKISIKVTKVGGLISFLKQFSPNLPCEGVFADEIYSKLTASLGYDQDLESEVIYFEVAGEALATL